MSRVANFFVVAFLACVPACDDIEVTSPESRGEPAASTPDTQAPKVGFQGLAAYQAVFGDLEVVVEAPDNVATTRVELLLDGQPYAACDEPPFAFTLESTGTADGVSLLEAEAHDAAGNVGRSDPLPLVVLNHGKAMSLRQGHEGTIRIPANYNGTQEVHNRHHWSSEEDYQGALAVATWEPGDEGEPWGLELSMGTGICPHKGKKFAPAVEGLDGVVAQEVWPDEGLPAGTQFFVHLAALEPRNHVGGSLGYDVVVYAFGAEPGPEASIEEGGAPSACPLNSGYPCACEGVLSCADGSDCVRFEPGATGGACSRNCAGREDHQACAATRGYGVFGSCSAGVDVQQPNHCILVCKDSGQSGPCPPGLACTADPDGGICLPERPLPGEGEDACYGVSAQGCCKDSVVYFCEQGELLNLDCGEYGCGWSDVHGFVKCNGQDTPPEGTDIVCPEDLP